jgi:hypothetical protein
MRGGLVDLSTCHVRCSAFCSLFSVFVQAFVFFGLLILSVYCIINCIACTENLILNDPGFVELSLERLGDNFDIDEFLFALQNNYTVKHVCFTGAFVRELTNDQWLKMLEGVGHLKKLEQLQIWCSTIPVDVFAHLLHKALKLRVVFFFHVRLDGSQQDFTQFSDAIHYHPSLSEFRFGGIDAVVETISFDCVLEALGRAEKMQVVTVQLMNGNRQNRFTGDALATLMSSKSITCLYLTRLGLGHDHYQAIATALTTNGNLRILDLFANDVQNDQLLQIVNSLSVNEGLEMVVLPGLNDLDFNDACSMAISDMIKINTSLASLYMPCSKFTDIGLVHLSESLSINTTLKKVEIAVSNKIGQQGMDALTDMLVKNYELERLVVDSNEKSIKSKIEYYMRLNAVGRGQLISSGQANRVEWVNMLVSVRDDLDCLFYFVSMNPTLCQFANTSGADVIVTEEFKRLDRRHSMIELFPMKDIQ